MNNVYVPGNRNNFALSQSSQTSTFPSVRVTIRLLTQYCAGGKIEKNEMGGACGAYGEGRGVHRVLVGKPEGKRLFGRPRRIWDDDIKMDLQEVGCGGTDWFDLAQERNKWRELVNAVMDLRVP